MTRERRDRDWRHVDRWLDFVSGDTPRPKAAGADRVHLAPVYILLILIIVLATVVSVRWADDFKLLDRFAPNLATESLGILLTVVFVRRFMQQAERSRRLRASVGALRKSRRGLQDLLDTWTKILKGCMQRRDHGQYTSAMHLCVPDNSELLLWCDPTAYRDGTDERWVHAAGRIARDAQAQLDQIIAVYAGTLEPEYVEAIDALTSDPFLRGFTDLTTADLEPQQWRVALNNVRALRMAHFERLLRTIELHNELAAEVAGVRGHHSAAPRTSMLGVELPADHDLKVDTVLDDGWWRSSPMVGSLRMQEYPARRATAETRPGA